MTRLYLDGCSLTWGQGLETQHQLASLLRDRGGYTVINESRPGKSNIAIAYDTYQYTTPEIYVLGWTFSSRFGIRYQDQNLDFFPGWHGGSLLKTDANAYELDKAYKQFYKFFYTVYESPYSDRLSDMLIDNTIYSLKHRYKKVVAFSWEQRKTINQLLYPYLGPDMRQDDGHLNVKGVEHLYNLIQNHING
jgi:hypothetical protein